MAIIDLSQDSLQELVFTYTAGTDYVEAVSAIRDGEPYAFGPGLRLVFDTPRFPLEIQAALRPPAGEGVTPDTNKAVFQATAEQMSAVESGMGVVLRDDVRHLATGVVELRDADVSFAGGESLAIGNYDPSVPPGITGSHVEFTDEGINIVYNNYSWTNGADHQYVDLGDNNVRSEFAAADDTLRDELTALIGDNGADFVYVDNGDNTVRSEFTAADTALRDELTQLIGTGGSGGDLSQLWAKTQVVELNFMEWWGEQSLGQYSAVMRQYVHGGGSTYSFVPQGYKSVDARFVALEDMTPVMGPSPSPNGKYWKIASVGLYEVDGLFDPGHTYLNAPQTEFQGPVGVPHKIGDGSSTSDFQATIFRAIEQFPDENKTLVWIDVQPIVDGGFLQSQIDSVRSEVSKLDAITPQTVVYTYEDTQTNFYNQYGSISGLPVMFTNTEMTSSSTQQRGTTALWDGVDASVILGVAYSENVYANNVSRSMDNQANVYHDTIIIPTSGSFIRLSSGFQTYPVGTTLYLQRGAHGPGYVRPEGEFFSRADFIGDTTTSTQYGRVVAHESLFPGSPNVVMLVAVDIKAV